MCPRLPTFQALKSNQEAQSLDAASFCLCMGFYREDKCMSIHLFTVKILSPLGVLSPLLPSALLGLTPRTWTIENSHKKTVTNNSDYRGDKGSGGSLRILVRDRSDLFVFSLPHPIHPVSGGLQWVSSPLPIPSATILIQALNP